MCGAANLLEQHEAKDCRTVLVTALSLIAPADEAADMKFNNVVAMDLMRDCKADGAISGTIIDNHERTSSTTEKEVLQRTFPHLQNNKYTLKPGLYTNRDSNLSLL